MALFGKSPDKEQKKSISIGSVTGDHSTTHRGTIGTLVGAAVGGVIGNPIVAVVGSGLSSAGALSATNDVRAGALSPSGWFIGVVASIEGGEAHVSCGKFDAVMPTAELDGLGVGGMVEVRVVAEGHPMRVSRLTGVLESRDPSDRFLPSMPPNVVAGAVNDFVAMIRHESLVDESMITALQSLPTAPRAEHLEQLRRNAELRRRFMKEVPHLKSADIARLSGSSARNVSAKANRWKNEGRVFCVSPGGVDHYPAFQFTVDGEPLPGMRDLLELFSGLSDWQIALWFFAPNAWLGDQPPMDVVQRDIQAVMRAAREAVEPIGV